MKGMKVLTQDKVKSILKKFKRETKSILGSKFVD